MSEDVRHRRPMSRFSDRAKRVLGLAGSEATRLNRDAVEPEHVLLGLLCCGDPKVTRVLAAAGMQLGKAREVVESLSGSGNVLGEITSVVPSPRTKEVIQRAATEADRAGDDTIEPGHVLLALLQETGTAARILESLGVFPDEVRRSLAN